MLGSTPRTLGIAAGSGILPQFPDSQDLEGLPGILSQPIGPSCLPVVRPEDRAGWKLDSEV